MASTPSRNRFNVMNRPWSPWSPAPRCWSSFRALEILLCRPDITHRPASAAHPPLRCWPSCPSSWWCSERCRSQGPRWWRRWLSGSRERRRKTWRLEVNVSKKGNLVVPSSAPRKWGAGHGEYAHRQVSSTLSRLHPSSRRMTWRRWICSCVRSLWTLDFFGWKDKVWFVRWLRASMAGPRFAYWRLRRLLIVQCLDISIRTRKNPPKIYKLYYPSTLSKYSIY